MCAAPSRADPRISFAAGGDALLSAIEKDRDSRRRYLEPYHGNAGQVACHCRAEPIPLGVGCRTTPYTTFYLYPLHRTDTTRHAIGCPLRVEVKKAGAETRTAPVLEVKEGKLVVNLAAPAYRNDKAAGDPADGKPAHRPTGERTVRRGRLLTLLEALWLEAELTTWRPWFAGKRHYWTVHHRLVTAVGGIRVRAQDLAPLFYMPPPYRSDKADESQQAVTSFMDALREREDGHRYYGYAAGLLREVAPSKAGVALSLAHTRQPFYMTQAEWDRWNARWFGGGDMMQATAAPVFVLLRVERVEGKRGPWIAIRDMAALQLADTTSWVPVDSDLERRLALRLVSEKRQFRKPLAVEYNDDDLVPDFILEDRADRMHLEVLGRMTDPEYRAHAEDKRRRYKQDSQEVWWWDVSTTSVIPALPGTDRG